LLNLIEFNELEIDSRVVIAESSTEKNFLKRQGHYDLNFQQNELLQTKESGTKQNWNQNKRLMIQFQKRCGQN